MNKTIIYIQCRTGSSRFPGKILSKINGKSYLEILYKRIKRTKKVDEVVIITTNLIEDNEIENLCKVIKAPIYRGSNEDLLDRHYQANKIFKGDFVVKIPSDCPFSDPNINEEIISVIQNSSSIEYASNYHPPTFPDGLDIEIARSDILERAWHEAKQSHEREHTFPYIWDNPEKFNLYNHINKLGNMFKTHRWTMDYQEDLDFVKQVYKEFNFSEDFFFEDILKLLKEKPNLKKINAKFNGINWYRNVPNKLKTINKNLYKL
tara:strand:- start:62 stop:850 length:789 start_codon:yes stop_codon:yes gene_type:complete